MQSSSLPKIRKSTSYDTLSLPFFNLFTLIYYYFVPKMKAFVYELSLISEKDEVVKAPKTTSSIV